MNLPTSNSRRDSHSIGSKFVRPPVLAAGLAILAMAIGSSAQAQVSLNSAFTFNMGTGLYTYSYGVTNSGAFDLAIVDVNVAPNAGLTNLTAPTGFFATYDPGLGIVSFLEDADFTTPQTFAPASTVSAFTFMSRVGPSPTTFAALDVTGNTTTGVTTGPIPEPATLLWGAAVAVVTLGSRKRRAA